MLPTTRAEAIAKKSRRYFNGKPCKHGHIAPRQTSSGGCTVCALENAKRWDLANPKVRSRNQMAAIAAGTRKPRVESKILSRQPRIPPPDPRSIARQQGLDRYMPLRPCQRGHPGPRYVADASCVQCRQLTTDRPVRRIYERQWREANPEKARDHGRRSRKTYDARKRTNGGSVTATDLKHMETRAKGRCAGCGKKATPLHLDHIIPVARGGASDPNNLQLLCAPCNQSKGAKDAITWAQHNGRLL